MQNSTTFAQVLFTEMEKCDRMNDVRTGIF